MSSPAPTTKLVVLTIPADIPASEAAEIRAANPNVAFIQLYTPKPTSATTPATALPTITAAAPQALTLWEQLATGILTAAGTALKVPAPWGPIVSLVVQGVITEGIPWVEALISKSPTTETWTLEQMKAEAARVAAVVPQT